MSVADELNRLSIPKGRGVRWYPTSVSNLIKQFREIILK
jgi:hypothetical protein